MSIWFPYCQHQTNPDPIHVVAANGAQLIDVDGRCLVDGISSWWCMIHGYNHPEITRAIGDQLGQLSHVMLGGLVHNPALTLANRLATRLPGDLNHVFFSDSGSVGVEVAIKMAIQFFQNRGLDRQQIAFFEGAYHGDTFGTMAVCDPEEGMHTRFKKILAQHVLLPRPPKRGSCTQTIDAYLSCVSNRLRNAPVAAVLIEPLMQGAGGFYLYDLAVLAGLRGLCDAFGILLIFDEVATGFGRLGPLFVADLGVVPDIIVLGKGLTGGHIGHAATVASDRVFCAFLSDESEAALMHGPTFMGNPLACRAALASLDLCLRPEYLAKIQWIETQLRVLERLADADGVIDVRVQGGMGVVEVDAVDRLRGFQAFAVSRGVWLRPFGRFAYTTPPSVITPDDLSKIVAVFVDWFQNRNECACSKPALR